MDTEPKDIWDKISASSGMIAAILVPVAVAFVGAQYSASIKQQELEATSRREYINVALTILRDPGTDDSLREWGTKIINHYADVEMPKATKEAFNKEGLTLPYTRQVVPNSAAPTSLTPIDPSLFADPTASRAPAEAANPSVTPTPSTESHSTSPAGNGPSAVNSLTSAQRIAKTNLAQTQGIAALLDRDFHQAVKAYGNAYAIWPEFRNVDEIQRLLKSSRPPENEQQWKDLYKQIMRYDVRGIDPAIIDRLRQEAR